MVDEWQSTTTGLRLNVLRATCELGLIVIVSFTFLELNNKSVAAYQLELLHQVINGGWRSANQDVLAIDEAEQDGQFQVAQAVDLVEQVFIRHRKAPAEPPGPSASEWFAVC